MKSGYTLIEVSVAVAIFFIVLAIPSGYLIGSLKSQIKTLASQELLDQTSYALEYISRALRMAKKDGDGSCIDSKLNYKKTESRTINGIIYLGPGIRFESYHDPPICQEIFLDNNDETLKESKNDATPLPLTSADLEINLFNIAGEESWGQNDTEQPRVTIFLNIKGGSSFKEELQPEIKIQTTVSQRNLDIPK